jgi:NADH:ubiquinone oxidoreductase subunit 6 (subunit J)
MSHLPSIVFYALAALLVLSSIGVVVLRNVFYSAVSLVAALTFVAGLFLLQGADFLGAAQVLVYVGGIMIIMLFVIMLSQQPRDVYQRQTNDQWLAAGLITITIAISLVRAFRAFLNSATTSSEMVPTSAHLGRLLLGDMLLPFEAVSLILLAALVGAVMFGQDKLS